jgi:hypothetical protein
LVRTELGSIVSNTDGRNSGLIRLVAASIIRAAIGCKNFTAGVSVFWPESDSCPDRSKFPVFGYGYPEWCRQLQEFFKESDPGNPAKKSPTSGVFVESTQR